MKLFSLFLTLLITSLSTTGCNERSPSSPGSPAAHERGGISGGGGGTVISATVDPLLVSQELADGRKQLLLLMNQFSVVGAFYYPEMAKILLDGKKTIFDVIRSTGIYPETDGACKDADGNENDGSIYAPKPGMICISVRRLSQKLTTENLRSQVLGLLAHEFSHLLGADEGEATDIQKYFVEESIRTNARDMRNFRAQAWNSMRDLLDELQAARYSAAVTKEGNPVCERLLTADSVLMDLENMSVSGDYSLFPVPDFYRIQALAHKLHITVSGSCITWSTDENWRQESTMQNYESGFASGSTVALERYLQDANIGTPAIRNACAGLTVSRIENLATAAAEISDVHREISQYFDQLNRDDRLYF